MAKTFAKISGVVNQQRAFWSTGVVAIGAIFIILCAILGAFKWEKKTEKFTEHFVDAGMPSACDAGSCSI
jgi:hypothetical protein